MTYAIYISEKYLKDNTNLSTNIDSLIIKPNLRKAQDIYISSFLGKTIDSELQNGLINNTLTTLQSELLYMVKKAQCEFTAHLCYVDVYFRFLNKSANIPSTETGNAMSLSDIVYVRDIAKNQGEFYLNQVRNFLIENKSTFPSFSDNCNNNNSAFKFQIEYDEKIKNNNYFKK